MECDGRPKIDASNAVPLYKVKAVIRISLFLTKLVWT